MDKEAMKKLAGEMACEYIEDGMVVGLGTGSTVYYTILKVAEMVKDGMDIIAIPTSKRTEELALERGIPLTDFNEHPDIDVTIDGADEVDPNLDLIKGWGGALVREKIVASATKKLVIVADGTKTVDMLGTKSPLPVEIIPFSHRVVVKHLKQMGCTPVLRVRNDATFITDNHNNITDCKFSSISDAKRLELNINNIPGVVDNGLFVGMAKIAIIANSKDNIQVLERP
jgi:ribose 5-phosphate isomerase A